MDILDQSESNASQYLTADEVLRRGYRFQFSAYFDEAITILRKNIGAFVLATLIFFGIQLVLSMIPFVGSIASLLVSPALAAGFVLMAKKASDGDNPVAGDLFLGFRREIYGRLLIAYILSVLLIIAAAAASVPIIFLAGPDLDGFLGLFNQLEAGLPPSADDFSGLFSTPQALWLLTVPLMVVIYLAVAMTLSIPFAALSASSGWDAIRSSIRIVSKNWFWFFVYTWLLSICAVIGIIALCVGILATYSIAMIGPFVAFDHIMKGKSSDAEKSV